MEITRSLLLLLLLLLLKAIQYKFVDMILWGDMLLHCDDARSRVSVMRLRGSPL